MKKIFTIFTTTLLLTALVISCGKETQSSTQGGGICKIRATITPPLQPGDSKLYNGLSGVSYNIFTIQCLGGTFQWTGLNNTAGLTSMETQEFSVTKGANVLYYISLSNLYDVVCRQVKVEVLIDNSVKKTTTLEMGYSKYNPTDPNNPILYCKDNYTQSLNFIVP